MKVSVAEARECLGDLFVELIGEECDFFSIDDSRDYQAGSLIFVADLERLAHLEGVVPAVIVTNDANAKQLDTDSLVKNACLVVVENVRLAQAILKQHYCDYDASDSEWDAIHETAVIHPTAQLGDDVRIGPNTVIGENVTIGNATQIRANCVIEHGVSIGSGVVIHNLVNVGYNCVIEDRVIIRPGAIVGNEGFGFAQKENSEYLRIPHTGSVVLREDVQIGSNCNIDRGTYGDTVIGAGSKIDALCHIAHNVQIGENVIIVAQTGIAGSAVIGNRVIASGQTGILDHMTVADDAVLVHRCGVVQDIPGPGVWAGKPAKPMREYMRKLGLSNQIEKLKQRIAKLESNQS